MVTPLNSALCKRRHRLFSWLPVTVQKLLCKYKQRDAQFRLLLLFDILPFSLTKYP